MPEDTRSLEQIPGFDDRPSIDPESSKALDDLLAKQSGNEPAAPKDTPAAPAAPAPKDEPKDPPAAPEPKDEPKDPSAAPKPTDEPKDPPAAPAPKDEPKDPPVAETPKDEFDEVSLPPYTKAKASEAFDKVKTLAREKITALETERDALKKQNEDLAAKAKQGIPKEVETELKELREFRNKLDVDADPEFKKFDEQITANDESIYARMLAAGLTQKHVDQVKAAGGPAAIDWDSVADKMPASLKRFIDAKLVENETLADKKARTLEEKKKNATEYVQNKQAEAETARTESTKAAQANIDELVPKLGWLEARKPKDGASEAEKLLVEKHNALVEESQAFLKDAVADDSPTARGLLAVGYIQLLKLRHDTAIKDAAHAAKVKELEGKLKETTELLERVKKSSTTRLRNSPADDTPAPKRLDSINTPGSEALDGHLKNLQQRQS